MEDKDKVRLLLIKTNINDIVSNEIMVSFYLMKDILKFNEAVNKDLTSHKEILELTEFGESILRRLRNREQ